MTLPLREWLRLRDVSRGDLERRGADVEEGRGYGRLRGLARVRDRDLFPGSFYFDGDRLVLLYARIQDRAVAPAPLHAELGEPAASLRSRAGKLARQHVYPERGVAFAADADGVVFVELFPPTTLDDYRARLYEEPPAIRK